MSHQDTTQSLFPTSGNGEIPSSSAAASRSTRPGNSFAVAGRSAHYRHGRINRQSSGASLSLPARQQFEEADYPAIPPLLREVIRRMSSDELDVLITLNERLEGTQDDVSILNLGSILDQGPWSSSQRIRGKLALVMPVLLEPNRALFNHPRPALVYPAWAVVIYQLARNFLPLMETALAKSQMLASSDVVAAELARYLEKHIDEERHGANAYGGAHLEDLEELGMDSAEISRQPLPDTVATLVGLHYDWIIQRHPVALLAFLEVAEGYPPPAWAVEDFIGRSGLPRSGFHLLLEHADLDLQHREELHTMLDGLPITYEQESMLGLGAMRTVDLMSQALWEALEDGEAIGDGFAT